MNYTMDGVRQTPLFFEVAERYHRWGFNVVPIGGNPHKPKAPFDDYQPWHHERQTPADLVAMPWDRATGVSAILGEVSGGLVHVDFDHVDRAVILVALDRLGLPPNYPWVRLAPDGGHIFVRAPELGPLLGKNKRALPPRVGSLAPNAQIELRFDRHIGNLPPSLHHHDQGEPVYYTWAHGEPTGPPATVDPALLISVYNDLVIERKRKATRAASPSTPKAASRTSSKAASSSPIPTRAASTKAELAPIERAIKFLPVEVADLYDDWLKIGMAIHDGTAGSEAGFQLWDTWSRLSSKYDGNTARYKWESFRGSGVTVATLFYEAVKHGYKPRRVEGIEPHWPAGETMAPEQAQAELRAVVNRFFQDARIGQGCNHVAVKLPPGGGKTRAVLQVIAHQRQALLQGETLFKRAVILYVPNHRLAEELKAELTAIDPHLDVRVMHGRTHEIDGQPLCKKADVVRAMPKGSRIGPNLCESKPPGGGDTLRCQYYTDCPYVRQARGGPDVLIFMHAHLPLDPSRYHEGSAKPLCAIIDEGFTGPLLRQHKVGLLNLESFAKGLDDPELLRVTGAVIDALREGKPLLSALRDQGIKQRQIRAARKAVPYKDARLFSPTASKASMLEAIQAHQSDPPLFSLLSALEKEIATDRAESHSVRYYRSHANDGTGTETENVAINTRKPIKHIPAGVPVLAIDGSMSEETHRLWFPDCDFHEIRIERRARVYQVDDRTLSKWSLLKDPKRGGQNIAELNKGIERLAAQHESPLIVAPKAVLEQLAIPNNARAVHFGGLRGLDIFKDCDCAVIIGRNQPSPQAAEDIARGLYFDSPEPLHLPGELARELRGYRLRDGTRAGVPVSVHPDSRVQGVIEGIREHETLQALDRLRLIWCKEPKTVYLLSSVPVDIDVDGLLNWDTVTGGARLEEMLLETGGYCPVSRRFMHETYSHLFDTENVAKNYIARSFESDYTRLMCLYRSYSEVSQVNGPFQLVTYRLSGGLHWYKAITPRRAPLSKARAVLEYLLGEQVAEMRLLDPPQGIGLVHDRARAPDPEPEQARQPPRPGRPRAGPVPAHERGHPPRASGL